MIGSDYLTAALGEKLEGQAKKTHEGQAHFAGSGPNGKTCGDCTFKGYYRKGRERWNEARQEHIARSRKVQGCEKFLRMTGIHGPDIPADALACKYFEQKTEA